MHVKPYKQLSKDPHLKETEQLANKTRFQDGYVHNAPNLLTIPSESLTHITSFLDPISLFAISRTNKHLYEHIKDDNTWHKAFENQFLGASAEDTSLNNQRLLFKRTESSWRKEYVHRYNISRRWERCRNATISHTPHYSTVSSMHLLSDRSNGPSILSSSLQYGVVARSQPMTGKVLKGFLDASGTGNGFGIGNPNVEFNPDVSTCALTSDGGTAKILWGHTHGEVAVTTAPRVMDSGRSAAKLTRCQVSDQHHGLISAVIWLDGGNMFVTASVDGFVKIWEMKKMKCLWTSAESLYADYYVKLVSNIRLGVLAGATKSGFIVVWTGLNKIFEYETDIKQSPIAVRSIRISPPLKPNSLLPDDIMEPKQLLLHPNSKSTNISMAILYNDYSKLDVLYIDPTMTNWQWRHLDDGPLGPIQIICPFNADDIYISTCVLAGDSLGRVTFFEWSSPQIQEEQFIPSKTSPRKLDALDDGAVTCLSVNAFLLAVGSSQGAVRIFDILNFIPLRSFPPSSVKSPTPNPSTSIDVILLERDLLIVSSGSRVMAWKADPVKERRGHVRSKKAVAGKRHTPAKWYQQIELRQDIKESRLVLDEERKSSQQRFQQRRDHLTALKDLGLDEVEAVNYALMLSRDDEDYRTSKQSNLADGELYEEDLVDSSVHSSGYSAFEPSDEEIRSHIDGDSCASLALESKIKEVTSNSDILHVQGGSRSCPVRTWSDVVATPVSTSSGVNDGSEPYSFHTNRSAGSQIHTGMNEESSWDYSGSDHCDDLQYAIELSFAELQSRQGHHVQ